MKEILLKNFLKISSIPRKSGQEEKIADFFCNIAIKNNLNFYKDDKNNVLIKKKGNIESKPIAFQAHLDMVCVKTEESTHDFDKDGIKVLIDGDICNEYRFKSSKINSNSPSYKIKISGFLGGNSGDNVNLSKNNAITTMAKLLYGKDLLLAQINGGTFENDIATSCEIIINTNEDVYSIFKNLDVNMVNIL